MTTDVDTLDDDVRARLTTLLVKGGHMTHPLRLCAHVETDLSPDALRKILSERVPAHMIPEQILTAAALPRLPNGKLDRSALNKTVPPPARIVVPQEDNDTLEALRAIWAHVLGTDEIYDDDNFVELGGDSLLSISVVSRARKAGIEILPSDLFDYSSLAELSKRVTQTKSGEMLPDVSAGPLDLTAGANEADAPHVFLLNANRKMLDQLNSHLENRRNLHLLTLHWDSGDISGFDTIEALAKEFLDRIRKIQPNGPYAIGGFSIGAVAAHEIALHLVDQGEDLRDLILIDPPENPTLFAGNYTTDHTFSGGGNEVMTVKRKLVQGTVLMIAGLSKVFGRKVPDRLKSRTAAAAYFRAARQYHIKKPAVRPIIVRRVQPSGTSMWATSNEWRLLFEMQCSHADFHRDENIIREWTGAIAKSLENKDH